MSCQSIYRYSVVIEPGPSRVLNDLYAALALADRRAPGYRFDPYPASGRARQLRFTLPLPSYVMAHEVAQELAGQLHGDVLSVHGLDPGSVPLADLAAEPISASMDIVWCFWCDRDITDEVGGDTTERPQEQVHPQEPMNVITVCWRCSE